jgi:hypothetical protein
MVCLTPVMGGFYGVPCMLTPSHSPRTTALPFIEMATMMSVSFDLQVQTFALALGIFDVRYDLREPSFETLGSLRNM